MLDVMLACEAPEFADRLSRVGMRPRTVGGAQEALEAVRQRPPDALLADLALPDPGGLWLVGQVASSFPAVGVMAITDSVTHRVEAMRGGAFDSFATSVESDELLVRLERLAAHQARQEELEGLRHQLVSGDGVDGLIGSSRQFQQVVGRIRSVARASAALLLVGEAGTGRERLARAIHHASGREGPFVPFSCGMGRPESIEQELFGAEIASEGRWRIHPGCLERAAGGTLFLDDVDDLPPPVQPKLRRALRDQRFSRVHGESAIETDIRVISASKVPLHPVVVEGNYRDDLYFQLAVVELEVPPLRKRTADIPLLAAHFLALARPPGSPVRRFSAGAMRRMTTYDWPGNLRQLENAVAHALAFCAGPEIRLEDLPERIRYRDPRAASWPALDPGQVKNAGLPATLAAIEERLVRWALDQTGQNQVQAARLLSIPRSTLQDKLRRFSAPPG